MLVPGHWSCDSRSQCAIFMRVGFHLYRAAAVIGHHNILTDCYVRNNAPYILGGTIEEDELMM